MKILNKLFAYLFRIYINIVYTLNFYIMGGLSMTWPQDSRRLDPDSRLALLELNGASWVASTAQWLSQKIAWAVAKIEPSYELSRRLEPDDLTVQTL